MAKLVAPVLQRWARKLSQEWSSKGLAPSWQWSEPGIDRQDWERERWSQSCIPLRQRAAQSTSPFTALRKVWCRVCLSGSDSLRSHILCQACVYRHSESILGQSSASQASRVSTQLLDLPSRSRASKLWSCWAISCSSPLLGWGMTLSRGYVGDFSRGLHCAQAISASRRMRVPWSLLDAFGRILPQWSHLDPSVKRHPFLWRHHFWTYLSLISSKFESRLAWHLNAFWLSFVSVSPGHLSWEGSCSAWSSLKSWKGA